MGARVDTQPGGQSREPEWEALGCAGGTWATVTGGYPQRKRRRRLPHTIYNNSDTILLTLETRGLLSIYRNGAFRALSWTRPQRAMTEEY